MLEIYLHDGADALTFRLKGVLVRPWAAELEQSCQTAASTVKSKELVIDLTHVTEIDDEGERVLKHLNQYGARYITASPETESIAREASGRPFEVLPPAREKSWRRLLCRLARCCHGGEISLGRLAPCLHQIRKVW